jgi:tellurium resistance protein TerD
MLNNSSKFEESTDIPVIGLEKYITDLAKKHDVTYVRTFYDELADTITRLSDDEIEQDDIQRLLITLKRKGVLNGKDSVSLLVNYLREKFGKVLKGESINLSKMAHGLNNIKVKLGWNKRKDFDLCVSVFLLDDAGKAKDEHAFIYYNNKEGASGAIKHLGDNITGTDITIKLDDVQANAPQVTKIAFLVTIHEAKERAQNFGQAPPGVEGAYISVVDTATDKELARYDLAEDYSTETAIVMGELYLKDGDWRMTAVGHGSEGGLDAALVKYGLM